MSARSTTSGAAPVSDAPGAHRIRLRHILCPSDGSAHSDAAARYARMIAGWYGAQITALHAVETAMVPVEYAAVTLIETDLRNRARHELEHLYAGADAADLDVQIRVVDGEPADEIVREARALPADLIVMGTHGRRGVERWVLGSVTEKVLRRAPCPVMSVSHPQLLPRKGAPALRTILCPVDVSHEATPALSYALSWAQEAEAHVILLYVIDDVLLPLMAGAHGFEADSYGAFVEERARERLSAMIPDDARGWCTSEEVLVHGAPHEEIVRTAGQRRADVIVMAAHGRRLGAAFFGSTTTQVVRSATCPVLTVREREAEGA